MGILAVVRSIRNQIFDKIPWNERMLPSASDCKFLYSVSRGTRFYLYQAVDFVSGLSLSSFLGFRANFRAMWVGRKNASLLKVLGTVLCLAYEQLGVSLTDCPFQRAEPE